MKTKLYTIIQIAVVMSSVWGPSQAVDELTCNTSTNLNQDTVATYRFHIIHTNPNATQLSCYFKFEVTDQSQKILLQMSPNCSTSDELSVNKGNNLCCQGCNQPPSAHVNLVTVYFIANNTENGEFRFKILIITGKDESNCSSTVTQITVGSSPVIITSPNFPEKYPSNVRCSYNISSDDPKKGLSLTFEVINLENRCYDWIKMALYNSEPIQTCNLSSNDLVLYYRNYISEGSVRLDFHTDNTIEAHGFRLKISQVQVLTCNTSISLNQATVTTYGFGTNHINSNAT